jgi:hypothetical protein
MFYVISDWIFSKSFFNRSKIDLILFLIYLFKKSIYKSYNSECSWAFSGALGHLGAPLEAQEDAVFRHVECFCDGAILVAPAGARIPWDL